MKNIKSFGELIEDKAPKFAVQPAAGDTGYEYVRKQFGADKGPKQKNPKTEEVEEANVQNVDNGSVKKIRITADDKSETVDVIKKEGYTTIVQNDADGKRVAIFITDDMVEELCKVLNK